MFAVKQTVITVRASWTEQAWTIYTGFKVKELDHRILMINQDPGDISVISPWMHCNQLEMGGYHGGK